VLPAVDGGSPPWSEDDFTCRFDKGERVLSLSLARLEDPSPSSDATHRSHDAEEKTTINQNLKDIDTQQQQRVTTSPMPDYQSESYPTMDPRQQHVRDGFNSETCPTRIIPLVRTPDAMIHRILKTASLTPRDHLCDLGSGDGRVCLIAAQSFGVEASGLEISETLVVESRLRASEHNIRNVSFHTEDMYSLDPEHSLFTRATVFFLHLMPEPVERLRYVLEAALRRGARIVTLNYHLLGAPIWSVDRFCPAVVCKEPPPGEEPPRGYVTEQMAKRDVSPAIKAQRAVLANAAAVPSGATVTL